ncbi:isoprenoid synthase domain-containing protein [Gigaspora rosea]|uniref:Isoprenoid synthase domain-containing protein n=1 Tax=Gigaspora rosea TaxID=44941 RepID=A0A397VQV5_9GLOM|nr:isoprenoid synthase domain-containing protein [Gigaspora rosea]
MKSNIHSASILKGRNTGIKNPNKTIIPSQFVGEKRTLTQVIDEAEKLVQHQDGSLLFEFGKDLGDLTKNIHKLLGSRHPFLNTVSKYYFKSEGKRIRPLLVLLMSQATSIAEKQYKIDTTDFYQITDKPLTKHNDLLSYNNKDTIYYPTFSSSGTIILPTQRRLAEIIEMIHTASLLHDDVIDNSQMRRNDISANLYFGNKMTILAGDFLLARASLALARLRNPEVIELIATIIANLVEGEFMQLKNVQNGTMSIFEYYIEKTYMKTASLMAKSCQAASVLGGATLEVSEIAYTYGRNLGLAFQLIDDMLDFMTTDEELGKPTGADLKLGLATAPVLYALVEYPELGPLIKRKFSQDGDVEKARGLVYKSNGIEQTKLLATSHCQKAIDAITRLPKSDARNALVELTQKVLTRRK